MPSAASTLAAPGAALAPADDRAAAQRAFKDALSSWATGVSVVTTAAGELVHGTTVSSFTSVSLEPPLVLVCLHAASRTLPMLLERGAFAVSMLAREQQEASAYFASSGRAPSASFPACELEWVAGTPALAGAIAQLACKLHVSYRQGDHTIVIGEVLEARHRADASPLLYHRRAYHGLDGAR